MNQSTPRVVLVTGASRGAGKKVLPLPLVAWGILFTLLVEVKWRVMRHYQERFTLL